MNIDEVVETSDPEELEELLALRNTVHHSPYVRLSQTDGRQSPRKRRKVQHDYVDILPGTLVWSRPSSPRTPGSPLQSTSDYTSPASLTRETSSKPSSPVATPPISVVDPSVSPSTAIEYRADPFESNSQDPLLLNAMSPKPHIQPPMETLPRSRSFSPAHVRPFFAKSESLSTPSRPQRSRSESVDPLLLFTPSRPSLHDESPGPSTSPEIDVGGNVGQRLSPPRTSFMSNPPSSPLSPPPPDNNPTSVHRAVSPPDAPPGLDPAQNHGRYALRQRQSKQIHPYQYDKAEYRTTLRHHPEAIVKVLSPKRGERSHHTHEDYEDSQTQGQEEMGGGYEAGNESENGENWEERPPRSRSSRNRSRSKTRSPDRPQKSVRNWNLPEMSSTDEEIGKSTDAFNKEARKVLRAQKREAREERASRKHPKPFPMKDIIGLEHRAEQVTSGRVRPHSPRALSPLRPVPPVFSPIPPVSPVEHFNQTSDLEMDGNSFSTSPWRKSRGTPIDISDTESDDLSNEDVAAKEKNKKQRAKIRAMNRMYPAVMRKKMMQEADAAAKAKKRHRPVQVSSESNQDEPLLPGRTRPRKGEHPRDIKDIKGDTESSNEAVSDSMDISRDNRPASSDSDVEVVVRPKQRHHVDNNREVWKSDEDISDGRIDDERIEAYLQEGPFRPSRFRERSMIDWMLDNTAEVGGTRRRRGSSRPRKLKGVVSGAPKQGAKRQGFDKRLDRGQSPELYRDRSPNLDPDIRAAPLLRTNPTHGPTHQTRLTFEKSSGRKRSFAHQQGDPSSYSERRHWVGGDDGAPISDEEVPEPLPNIQHIQDIPDPVALRKAARKQKEKERRAHMNMNGIWVFNNKGIRIAKAITIDVADRGFHQALAPRNAPPPARVTHNNEKAPVVSKARSKPKPHTNAAIHQRPRVNRVKSNGRLLPRGERRAAVDRPDPEIDEESENPEESENLEAAETEHRDLTTTSSSRPSRTCQFLVDFGLSKLPSGTGFDASTYIRKGALVELLELLSADPQKPPPPGCYSAHEFDLGPEVDLHRMLAHMDQICDRFFEFATGLPEDSEETAEQATGWEGLMHVICQLVSWYLAAGDDIEVLKDAVQTQIIRLTSQIRAASLTAKSMDATTFSLCWFAVELSARLGFRFPIWSNNRLPESNLLFESTTLLIEHLLEYGLEPVLDLLKVEGALEGATPSHRALEVWVCLLHLCGSCQALDAKSASPLWKMIQNTLAARQSNAASHLDASEDAWQVLIGLQTISRFNQHGMTVQTSILPASWPFVVFCLERIRFKANEDVDHTLSESGLDNLDIYIKLVVQRCCHLWSKWGWACDDAFDALCRLVDIFKSRQFADLRHEGKPDFPDFLRTNEWDFLDRQIHSETAFVLFLKLVYQTLQVNKSKVNKLLSLAMPIATLPFSKERPPRLQDLSMLYNRLSALAIAIHVDPTQQVRWIQLARGYIKFQDADATTRNAHIRGLMYLSIVMVQGGLALDEPIRWLEEMVNVLLDQHKHKPDDRSVIISLHLLVGCVDKVLQAYVRQYPDPRLILSLERIFRSPTLIKANTESAHAVPRVMRSFLQARAVAIPPPKRPSLPVPATEQESQEDYGDEMWNDAMLADLDKEESITDAQIKAKDASIRKLLEENIAWTLFRQTAQYTNYSGMQKSLRCDDDWSVDFASLVECWLGCGSIVIQNGHKSWQQYLSSYFDSSPKQLDDFSTRKIKLLMYSNVLKLDPMTYLDPTMQEAFMGVLFESLATWYTTVEDEFIQLLLSIDGLQHPLLTDASWKRDETIASKIELLDLRIPLLKVIISNLSDCLHDGLKPEENSRYVTWLIAMYTAMKEIHSELKDESQGAYARWCVEVGRALRSHPIFLGEGRLAQWIAWAGRLEEE